MITFDEIPRLIFLQLTYETRERLVLREIAGRTILLKLATLIFTYRPPSR